MATASLTLNPQTSFDPGLAAENSRSWSEQKYIAKNKDSGNHYDWSRRHLNFSLIRDEQGRTKIAPLTPGAKMEKFKQRLAELNFKQYKEGSPKMKLCCVDIILGGSHDRMAELAFGGQEVAFDLTRSNNHIHRQEAIEQWAIDSYDWACKKWGAENICGFEVHLDEMTPHAHVLLVPVGMTKAAGRSKQPKTGDAPQVRKEKLSVSFKKVFGNGAEEVGVCWNALHDDYHAQVGYKYGLDRGENMYLLPKEERKKKKHLSKEAYGVHKDNERHIQTLKNIKEDQMEALNDLKEDYIDLLKEVNKKEDELKSKIETLSNLNDIIEAKKADSEYLDHSIREKSTHQEELITNIQVTKDESERLDYTIQDKQAHLDDLNQTIERRTEECRNVNEILKHSRNEVQKEERNLTALTAAKQAVENEAGIKGWFSGTKEKALLRAELAEAQRDNSIRDLEKERKDHQATKKDRDDYRTAYQNIKWSAANYADEKNIYEQAQQFGIDLGFNDVRALAEKKEVEWPYIMHWGHKVQMQDRHPIRLKFQNGILGAVVATIFTALRALLNDFLKNLWLCVDGVNNDPRTRGISR